jgi:DNA-directed RNA polymerase specialized sigma24 family protein
MGQTARLAKESPEHCGELSSVLWALSGLSSECRRVLTLRKVYGWENDRIAVHLGIEKQKVENHLRVCAQSIARIYERS